MTRRGSLAEQLANYGKESPVAANDNRRNVPAYRGTLPALRWLFTNHPDLAVTFAEALPKPDANWFVEVEPTRQEIRPTIGELIKASKYQHQVAITIGGRCYTTIGDLRFLDGLLIEWGTTKKGRKLRPADRVRPTGGHSKESRNPQRYLSLRGAVRSCLDAEHLHRPFTSQRAIASMYDPRPGVETARAVLQSFGVDGSVPANRISIAVKHCPPAVANGAAFLGGVSSPSGNSSNGSTLWDAPEEILSEVRIVVEEVAARGTLKSIGIRLGHNETYADRAGKRALLDAAEIIKLAKEKKSNTS